MANDLQTSSDSNVTELMSGIVNDAQELFKQQLALFKVELSSDMRRTREIAYALVLGLGTLLMGCILLCLTLVHFLDWLFPTVPTWVWYGIVGGAGTVIGWTLVAAAQQQFQAFNPLPEQSAKALEENLEWKTKSR